MICTTLRHRLDINFLTIWLIIAITEHFKCPLRQLNASNAFLHWTLENEVFMEQPIGFVDSRFPNHIMCRLNKVFYMGSNNYLMLGFIIYLKHRLNLVFLSLMLFTDCCLHIIGLMCIYFSLYIYICWWYNCDTNSFILYHEFDRMIEERLCNEGLETTALFSAYPSFSRPV